MLISNIPSEVLVRSDGAALAFGNNDRRQCSLANPSGPYIAAAAGGCPAGVRQNGITVLVRRDGTVESAGAVQLPEGLPPVDHVVPLLPLKGIRLSIFLV